MTGRKLRGKKSVRITRLYMAVYTVDARAQARQWSGAN